MKKQLKLTIAAGVFLLAVALKLVLPSGHRAAASVSPAAEPPKNLVVETVNLAEFMRGDGEALPVIELTEPAVEEAVAVFLERQEEFSDYAVPANVTYNVYALPFEYTAPVTAVTSSGFGYRVHPLEHVTKFHYGTDFAADCGDDILCFADGVVSAVEEDDSYGKHIRVAHESGYETLYAHCSTVYVTPGQTVRGGEKIALVGSTGQATGPHLHFELARDGIYTNPEFYLAALL